MQPYVPEIDNPYPDVPWTKITAFEYASPLHLYRAIEAVEMREGEDAKYIVARDYRVRFKLDDETEFRTITVPRGMLTDLTSVPWFARWLVGRVGPHLEAAIVHDFLGTAWIDLGGRGPREDDRAFGDRLMLAAMEKAEVAAWRRRLIYRAVRWLGRSAYRLVTDPRYVRMPPDADDAGAARGAEA